MFASGVSSFISVGFFLKYMLKQKLRCNISDEQVKEANEAIEADTPREELRHEPYSLPGGFNWDTLNLHDPLIVSVSLAHVVN